MGLENLIFFVIFYFSIKAIYIILFEGLIIRKVIWMIFFFFLISMLLFLLNMEFLGLLVIIIYIGAIAVLFLFIVMLLDIKTEKVNYRIYEIKFFYFFVIFFQILTIFFLINIYFDFLYFDNFLYYLPKINYYTWDQFGILSNQKFFSFIFFDDIFWDFMNLSNIEVLGISLYSKYSLFVVFLSLIIFTSIFGSILISFGLLIKNIKRLGFFDKVDSQFFNSQKNLQYDLLLVSEFESIK